MTNTVAKNRGEKTGEYIGDSVLKKREEKRRKMRQDILYNPNQSSYPVLQSPRGWRVPK